MYWYISHPCLRKVISARSGHKSQQIGQLFCANEQTTVLYVYIRLMKKGTSVDKPQLLQGIWQYYGTLPVKSYCTGILAIHL